MKMGRQADYMPKGSNLPKSKANNVSVGKPSLSGYSMGTVTTAPTAGKSVKGLKGKSVSSRGYDAGLLGGASGAGYGVHKGGSTKKGGTTEAIVALYHSRRGK